MDYTLFNVFDAVVLSGSPVLGTVLGPGSLPSASTQFSRQLVALIVVDATVDLTFEFSYDGITWYQETFGSITGGVETDTLGIHTLSAAGNYRLGIPITDRYFRVTANGTATITMDLIYAS